MHLKLENKKVEYDITIDIPDSHLIDGNVFLDPSIMMSGIFRVLKKLKIINKIIGIINYNYVDYPVALINRGILKQYNKMGVQKHFDTIAELKFNDEVLHE